MTGELTLFKNGSVPSLKFKGVQLPAQRLDDGVAAGFPRVSYKGSKWGIRFQGAYTPIQVRMPDGMLIQSPYLDVVILRASGHPNKAWYAGAYSEGETSTPPDCWASNGATPDAGAPNKQSRTCVGCVHNVWGSKINRDTGLATRGKACMDSKRLAVVPVGDIMNKMYGGPMMLSVPPSSLKRLGPYQNMLEANGFHYAAVWTRITFEAESAYPLFNFDAIAALDDMQADQVLAMINHPQIDRILDAEQASVEAWDESAASVHQAINPDAPQTAAEAMAAAQATKPADSTVVQFSPRPGTAQPAAQPATAKTSEEIEAEIAERVRQAVAAASKPATPAVADPATPAVADPGPMPAALVRTPQPAGPAAAAPAPEPDEPQAEQPETPAAAAAPTLPPGMILPPGMTPEMAAVFMSQFTAPAAKAPRRGRTARTPAVSPAVIDTTNQPSVAGPGLPVAAAPAAQPAAATPVALSGPAAAGGAAGADAAVASIMGRVNALI